MLAAGECVVQPPGIRHRVLECGPGLEVREVTCPAVHATHVDHTVDLPTRARLPDRVFGGQRFAHARIGDPAIAEASDGLVAVRRLTPRPGAAMFHDAELVLWYVLAGRLAVRAEGHDDVLLDAGDAVAIPRQLAHAVEPLAPDLDVVEVTVPAHPHVGTG